MTRRRDNWDAICRVFQLIIDDFGPGPGLRIIRCLCDVLGRQRLNMPDHITVDGSSAEASRCPAVRVQWKLVPGRCETAQSVARAYLALTQCIGAASARAVIYRLMVELKGQRISWPNLEDLCRLERNEQICNQYRGDNVNELAAIYGLSPKHIHWIVRRNGLQGWH